MSIQTTDISVDRDQAIPLSRQLYMQLHHQIIHGQIPYRERLPATRLLAAELGLARGVVVECYEMLKTDGLVAGFGKAGTQVCHRCMEFQQDQYAKMTEVALSKRGKLIASVHNYSVAQNPAVPLPLTPGVPDFSLFPYSKWQSLSREASLSAPAWYQRSSGITLLKQNLRNYLAQYRGIHVSSLNCLLVTSGIQAALSLLARMLADPGDTALLDRPGWLGARAAIAQAGLKAIYAPIDEQGTQLSGLYGGKSVKPPKIIVTTPSAQYPTGRPMSSTRRDELIQYSARNKTWLIEDDYAAEYSYALHPTPSLLTHNANSHLIHLGTMSKIMLPSLRLGWMVVPEHIAPALNNALNTHGIQPSYMVQQQLGRFMQYGYFSTHLAHTRTIYNERHRLCLEYIQQHDQDWLTVMPSISGMNHYLRVDHSKADVKGLKKRLSQAGLGCEIYTQSSHEETEYYLLLGHANLQEHNITEQLDKLLALHV